MARTLVGTSPILGYGSLRCTAASPVDLMSVNVQASVPDTPPEERGRHMEWLMSHDGILGMSAGFISSSRTSVCIEMVVSSTCDGERPYCHHHDHHYTLVDDFRVAAVEVAADELLPIGGPQSTVVSPTAYARSAYSPYAGSAPSSGPVFGLFSTSGCGATMHRSHGGFIGGVSWS